jgi:hypothetical protein
MKSDELIALIEQEEAQCLSAYTGVLAEQRRKALQYYYGQPYGNEVEGRSQVVTTEVKDAIEGIMPSLMAIFTSSDEVVRFEPQNPDDEAKASQATDYCNYVFSRLNNGFLALYCLVKDALLAKNGYVKVYWENYEDNCKETYEDLTDIEFQSLSQDEELELVEHTEEPAEVPEQMQMAVQAGLIPQPMTHDAVFRRSRKYGKICIDPIPPEEVLISRETPNDLSKARFVEHRTLKTISEIREMGYDIEDNVADYAPNADFNQERVERNKFDDALAYRTDQASSDPTTRRVWLCEAYLKVDYDGDGIAEFRKVTKVGRELLDNEEFDSLPILGGAAIVMPHKHFGLSIFDLVGDIQLVKSTITRQLLDNAYVANNGRMAVLDGMVNMDDLLTSRPNGVVRMKAMNALQRIEQPVLGAPFYNLLEYFDKVKTNRVGARDFGDAVDPDALNAKAHTAEIVRSAAQERINLMARILAEGPVKQIFWKILELSSKHQNKPQMVKLRGQWVQVDPRQWRNRFDMTVTVGLGTGSQSLTMNGAMQILQVQQGILAAGLGGRVVNEGNVYHAARLHAKSILPKYVDMLYTDPTSLPPPQPKPDPEMLKVQLAAHKAEMGDAQKRDKMAIDAQLEQMRQKLEGEKVQFQAMVDSALKDKDHQADASKQILEMANQQRQLMMEKLAELRLATDEKIGEKENILLEGKIQSLLDAQQQQTDLMHKMLDLQAAERENEVTQRDEKGKVKKTVSRIKK